MEPKIRRSVLLALRETARTVLLPQEREQIAALLVGEAAVLWADDMPLKDEWYPDRLSVEIVEALHRVLSLPRFHTFVDALVDRGFGRLRKMFLGIATPMMLASRAPEFWRYDHQTGEMTAVEEGEGVLVTIRDHPYARSEACRSLMAEYIRYAVSLTRVRSAVVSRRHDANSLSLVVRWS